MGAAIGAAVAIDGGTHAVAGLGDLASIFNGNMSKVGTHNILENTAGRIGGQTGRNIYDVASTTVGLVIPGSDVNSAREILTSVSSHTKGLVSVAKEFVTNAIPAGMPRLASDGYGASMRSFERFKPVQVENNTQVTMTKTLDNFDGVAAKGTGNPLSTSEIENILTTEKGNRPDPSTYLSSDYIASHLAQFDEGATKFMATSPKGVVGPPGGTFVMPKSTADQLVTESSGSVGKLENLLGLKQGTLGSYPVRVDIKSPSGLGIPSGNEPGANSQWIPGGFTSGGLPEATINPAAPGTYTVNPIFK